MHDRLALADIILEFGQRIAAERLEILLDLDLDVRAGQGAAQGFPLGAELVGHAGQEKLNRHRSAPRVTLKAPRARIAAQVWHGRG